MLPVSFYTPWKHQKNYAFLMFSRGIERDKRHEMGSAVSLNSAFNANFECFEHILQRFLLTLSIHADLKLLSCLSYERLLLRTYL